MMLRSLHRFISPLQVARVPRPVATFCTSAKPAASPPPTEETLPDDEDTPNLLVGKKTRESIHSTYASRAMDCVRYEYFAQRAELEAELEAAAVFRQLMETSKQQAMGYLELMEEYGDAEFGCTEDNVDLAAEMERETAVKTYIDMSGIASEEGLDQVSEWFVDMSDAGSRAAERLDIVGSIMRVDGIDPDMVDGEDGMGEEKK